MPKLNSNKHRPLLLVGSYGRGNVGDDAFLLAALQLFKGRPLYINSADDTLLPTDAKGQVYTIPTNGLKGLRQKVAMFRAIQAIAYCGGDVWVELYGDRFPRQSLYKMILVNLLARICGKRVYYLGVGMGLLSGYSLFLARLSASMAQGIVMREPRSAAHMALDHITVLPDLVTTVPVRPQKHHRPHAPITIGVSILYHVSDPKTNFPKLIHALASVLNKLPRQSYRLILFPMLVAPDEPHDDLWASEQLQAHLPHANVSIYQGHDVKDYIQALADIDVLIGTRLHSCIIAMLAGVPILGISYRPKVEEFFAMHNLGAYCIPLSSLSPARLERLLQAMIDHYDLTRKHINHARKQAVIEGAGYKDFIATHLSD